MSFVMVGDGGFAISPHIRQFMGLLHMPAFSNIIIKSFVNEASGYCFACKNYDWRTEQNFGYHPALPQFECLINHGGVYLNPDFSSRKVVVDWRRYFSVVVESGFGVSDDFLQIVSFAEGYSRYECEIFESPDLDRTLCETAKKYENQRMAMSGYVLEPLMMPGENKLNKFFLDYPLLKHEGFHAFHQLIQPSNASNHGLQRSM